MLYNMSYKTGKSDLMNGNEKLDREMKENVPNMGILLIIGSLERKCKASQVEPFAT